MVLDHSAPIVLGFMVTVIVIVIDSCYPGCKQAPRLLNTSLKTDVLFASPGTYTITLEWVG